MFHRHVLLIPALLAVLASAPAGADAPKSAAAPAAASAASDKPYGEWKKVDAALTNFEAHLA